MSWNVCFVGRVGVGCLMAIVAATAICGAQDTNAWPEARSADVASIDAMVKAAYEAVSAAPGTERDLDRFRSLWRPGSRLVAVSQSADGGVRSNVLTLEDFARAFSGPVAEGVYERESNSITEVFGDMAHAWSTYEILDAREGEVRARGINSLQLVHEGGRWWFVAGLFQNEASGLAIPDTYSGR